MTRPIAIVVSEPTPLSGQTNRSSGNFSTEWYGSAKNMIVQVSQSDNSGSIQFNIMEDRSGHDPTVFKDVKNGDQLELKEDSNFYIANPQYAEGESFEVTLRPA